MVTPVINATTKPRPINVGGTVVNQPRPVLPGMGKAEPAPGMSTTVSTPPPAFGLVGAEAALSDALSGTLNTLNQGTGMALDLLNMADVRNQDILQQALAGNTTARNDVLGALEQANRQIASGRSAVSGSINSGIQELSQGQTAGLDAIRNAIAAGATPLQGFVQPGQQSLQVQAALSGALGPEAQQQAFDNFVNSPGFQFQSEQGQRAIVNNAAALGGLGGGAVREELIRFGQGLASQELDNQFNRLGSVTGTGLNAANALAGLHGQEAALSSNLISSIADSKAGLRGQQASALGNLSTAGANVASNIANNLVNLNALDNDLFRTGIDTTSKFGLTAADLLSGNTALGASAISNVGDRIAALRNQAGSDIARNISDTTQGAAAITNQTGTNASNLVRQNIGSLADILSGFHGAEVNQDIALAELLGNLAVGQGSQIADLQAQIGAAGGRGAENAANTSNQTVSSIASLLLGFA